MLYILLLTFAVLICGYFTFRYFSLTHALKSICHDMKDIQQNLSENQILHLPIPDSHLGALLCSINSVLKEIQNERIRYEQRERELQKQIENISHDLRTPLTVILGYLKLAKTSGSTQALSDMELTEMLDIIEQKAESMKLLVDAFYEYSRLNAGDYKLVLQSVDVAMQLRESLMGNYKLLSQKQIDVNADIPAHPVRVTADESALERIFFNLLQNAGRYAQSWLKVEITEQEETVSVLFTNDTRLLSENDIPHLFDRFYMQDASRGHGGTGLGLTVSKALAEEMHGTLRVSVPEDEASCGNPANVICFELLLPAESDT